MVVFYDKILGRLREGPGSSVESGIPVPGQGIITEGDNDNNALAGKTYITTQAEFDAMIEAANAGTAVDAVLGAGVFRVKTTISFPKADIKIAGSAGTVLKRNNRVFKRTDADTGANMATHWAVALGEDAIVPFSIFLDEKDRIMPVSQYSRIEHTTENYYLANGKAVTNSRNVGSDGIFYIPKGDITINEEQLAYVFGYLDDSWTVDKFQLTGNVVTITKDGTSDTIDCFEAKILPYAYGSSARSFGSNIASYKSSIGLNSFVLYNVVSDDAIYYNGTHLYIPNGVSSVEVVDGWYNGIGSDFSHYTDRPTRFIGNSSASQNNRRQTGKVDISGIKFVGFVMGIQISDHGSNAPLDGVSIRNSRFESFTAMAIHTTLNAQAGHHADKETSYIENCEFADCGLSGYPVVIAEANVYGSHGVSGNCIGTGKNWIIINQCLFDGFAQGINPYKRSYTAVLVRADAEVRNCVFRNFSASQLSVTDGVVTVDGNRFGNTADFLEDKERNIGNDFGLVYLDGAKRGYDFPVTISNNILAGGTTQHTTGFRSIYMDEGRNNVHVIGNVIYGVFAATAIDSRQTSDGVITFYAWKNASDTVYTTSRKSRPSYIYTHDAKGFTSTGVMLEFGLATAATEITYDSKTWTYDSESNIDNIDWSSADNEYRENIVEGRMRLVYGNDVQADMLPTVTKNLQLGHYTNILGSYAQTSNRNPYADNSVDAGDNIVTESYKIGDGLVGVSGVYDQLTELQKQKVVIKRLSNYEPASEKVHFVEESFGKYDSVREITLNQATADKYVNTEGSEAAAAGYGISGPINLNFGDILLVPSATALPTSVSVVARIVTKNYDKVINYTYTYQQADPTLYDTATADYDPTLVYTAVYDNTSEPPTLVGWAIGGETIETLPATHEVTESYYEPLVKQAVSAMPNTGYYVYLCQSNMTAVISGLTSTVNGGICKVVGWGIFKNIVSNFIGMPGQAVLAQALCDLDARINGIMARLENLGEVKAITVDSENLPKVCGQPLVVEGSGAPSVVPQFIGQRYHDTTNSKCYEAFAVTASTNDWKLLN